MATSIEALERLGSMLATAQLGITVVFRGTRCPGRGSPPPPVRAGLRGVGDGCGLGGRRGARGRPAHRVLPARRGRGDDPQEHRHRRPGAIRAAARATALRHHARPAPHRDRDGDARQGARAPLRDRAQGRDPSASPRRRWPISSASPVARGSSRSRDSAWSPRRWSSPTAPARDVAVGSRGDDRAARCDSRGHRAASWPGRGSRYPVLDAGGDIAGYLHLKDVLYADDERHELPVPRSGSAGSPPSGRATRSRTSSPPCSSPGRTSLASSTSPGR